MIAARCTLAALALAACVLAQEDNRAPNPGFERVAGNLPAGWAPSIISGEGERITLAHVDSLRGGKCLLIDSRDPQAKAGWSVTERIPVVPGQQVTIRMQVRLEGLQPGPGGGDGFVITCHFYDRTSYLSWAPSAGVLESMDWHAEEFTCRVPEGAVFLVLGFRLSRCTGRALVDDVELYAQAPERTEPAPPYGLPPNDPGARMAVGMVLGADAQSAGARQLIDLLNREGIAVVVYDPVNIARFPDNPAALREFACVLIGALNPESGAGLLTAGQRGALRSYLEAGGGLVACAPAIASSPLAECFAAQIGEPIRGWHFIPQTTDPAHPILTDIVFPWPGFGSKPQEATCRRVQAAGGAHVLATVPEQVAGPGVAFLLCNEVGAGRVVLMNSSWVGAMAGELLRWRYAPRLLAQMARWAAGLAPEPAEAKTALPEPREPIPCGGRWHGAAPDVRRALPDPAALPEAIVRVGEYQPGPAVEVPVRAAAQVTQGQAAIEVRFGNGVRLLMHKAARIELFAPDGTRLTAEPADEQPLIASSGTGAAELAVDLEAGAAEPQIFRAPIGDERMLGLAWDYRSCEPAGAGVTFRFGLQTGGEPVSVRWSFVPRSVLIEGRAWHGVGERLEVDCGAHYVDSIMTHHPWRIGRTVRDDRTMRLACYSQPRGWYEMPLDTDADSGPHNAWSFFCSGQAFQLLGGAEGTLLLYFDQPTQIRARQLTQAGRDAVYLDNQVVIGRRRGTVGTPVQWMLFCPGLRLTPNTWLQAGDHVRREYEAKYRVTQSRPVPCGQMRLDWLGTGRQWVGRTVRMTGEMDLREIADYFLPLAAERGIRRVDVGTVVNPEHPLDAQAEPERAAAIRYLCDKAHSLGIEVLMYWRISYWNQHAPVVVEHPQWWNRTREGTASVGFGNLVSLSLRSGWYEWSLDTLVDLHRTLGIDGVWFDTLTAGMDAINYAEAEPQPSVQRGLEYFRELRDAGLEFWVEGMHPLALDSYWYRHDKYEPFAGVEFCLRDSSLYAHGPDSLIHLDPFRLAAFRAPMMADLSELTVADDPVTREQARCNRLLNAVEDALGGVMAIRCTEFGSLWIGTRGYAVFAFEDRRVRIVGLDGDGWRVSLPEARGGSLTVARGRVSGHLLAGEMALITRE